MCGIAGKISFTQKTVVANDIKKMTDKIVHRGPDDEGVFISKNNKVGLGHRRLSIIDLSPLGHQPMSYKNRYQIVFNGEIYNFQSARDLLKKKGYSFTSQTDTEVILALYDTYREKCLNHLRGMFAFAIYDEKEQILFCARDRVGKKPFKYYHDQNVFMFASELKGILTQKEYKKEPDYIAIHHYLTLQYVPAPLTGFKGIQKLEPGHHLTLNINTRELIKKRYWRLDYSKKIDSSEDDWKKKIIDKLDESTAIRMISDVPLGAFLSGGIDSSAVVAMMSRHSISPVKTFSIGFEEAKYNELGYARMIADKFKTDHTEFIVKPEAIDMLPLLVSHYEEPYADSSALPSYYVSKLTKKHVTVALNGDGGDENFAGYSRYSIQKFSLAYDRFRIAHKLVGQPAAAAFYKLVKNTLAERANRFAQMQGLDYRKRFVNYICYFSNQAKDQLYTDSMKEKAVGADSEQIIADKFIEAKTPDKLDQTLYADFASYLPDDLLVKMDIASMANSLETRSPFLDHEMLEMTAQIPFNLKLKGRDQKKYILKEALRGIVPEEVMFRPKMGFGVPIEHWFRGDLTGYIKSVLLSKKAVERGIFKPESIEKLLSDHKNTKVNLANQIWALLTLELWFQEYFD